KRREIFVSYLMQEGLIGNSDWAIVDSGLFLNCQRALKRVICSVSNSANVRGYYLAIAKGRAPAETTGFSRGFLQQDGAGVIPKGDSAWIFKRGIMNIVETFFTPADHPTVIGYERMEGGRITPVFKKVDDTCSAEHLSRINVNCVTSFL